MYGRVDGYRAAEEASARQARGDEELEIKFNNRNSNYRSMRASAQRQPCLREWQVATAIERKFWNRRH